MGVVGDLVARHHHEQQRQLAQLGRERREQELHRLVGPVQVVEHDRDRAGGGDARERAPERLDQRAAPVSVAAGPSSGSSAAR